MRKLFFAYCILCCLQISAQHVFDSTLIKANDYLLLNKPNITISMLDSVINNLDNNNTKQAALQLMSNAWKAKGNQLKSLQYHNEMLILKDSLNTLQSTATINILKSNYEEERQAKELAIQTATIAKQQFLITSISIISALIIAFLIVLYKRKQSLLKTKMQAAILEQKTIAAHAILEAEEKERKRIASDLHDGIGQMMSAVKMNLSSISSKVGLQNEQDKNLFDKTMALVDESCKEVRIVSHNLMPNALLKSGLSSAVKTFLDKIDHKQLNVHLYTEGLEERLNDNTEIILYRAIQEIVNNVIKHAQANQLDISLIKDADGISCTIEDNGIGFFLQEQQTIGIGLKNIKSRIDYLNGTVEWDSQVGKGTLVAIHIPYAETH
ncbi:MAG: sensor histidine kinase [Chitinophagaceae bacterium]|nr:sensor histidine kinase [Chitinophagaceae bacterium]MCW5905390.1 sensor histidine kinase [Chitinophagaceae bacterium]